MGKSDTQASYVLGSKFVDPRRVLQLSWQPRSGTLLMDIPLVLPSWIIAAHRNVFFTFSNLGGLKLFGMYRVFLYRGFLSEEESDHLISLVNFQPLPCLRYRDTFFFV